MSRSVFGAVCLESFSAPINKAEKILNENEFKEITGDYEYMWVKENFETNYATYVKPQYMPGVFLLSVWLQDMTDNSCRERCVEALGQFSDEVKDARKIIKDLLNLFEDKFKKIECYVYERDYVEESEEICCTNNWIVD